MSVNEKMTAIADAIRMKTGGTDSLSIDQMAAEITGITAGSENHLDYAYSLNGMFNGVAFDSGTELEVSFGSKTNMAVASNALYGTFYGASGLKTVSVNCPLVSGAGVSMQNAFRMTNANSGDSELERIDFTGAQGILLPSNLGRTFEYRKGLKEILGEFDMSKCTAISNAWTYCYALETIRFKEGTINAGLEFAACSNLTDESVQSIIAGLADRTDSTALTLTFNAGVGAKLTEEQKAAASAKNWTLAY